MASTSSEIVFLLENFKHNFLANILVEMKMSIFFPFFAFHRSFSSQFTILQENYQDDGDDYDDDNVNNNTIIIENLPQFSSFELAVGVVWKP